MSLYSAGTLNRTPGEIQQDVLQLGQRLEQWVTSLPPEFNYQQPPNELSRPFIRERILLAFQLCSAKMLLTRPCLTGPKQSWREANEVSFATRMANTCVESAKTIVDILPSEPQSVPVHDQGPWWCIIHHLMQAISIFLLALSHPPATSYDSLVLISCTKKAVRWLQTMQDPVSQRAYRVALTSLDGVARRYCVDISDLWSTGIEDVMDMQGHGQHPVSDAFIPTYLPSHIESMPAPTTTHAAVVSYAAYDAVMTSTIFSPYYGPLSSSDSYYTARS